MSPSARPNSLQPERKTGCGRPTLRTKVSTMTADSGFVSARDLSAGFHDDVIRPLLAETPYAAGLLGWGSDVLGYDTARSTDHGWGPRLNVFVDADEVE